MKLKLRNFILSGLVVVATLLRLPIARAVSGARGDLTVGPTKALKVASNTHAIYKTVAGSSVQPFISGSCSCIIVESCSCSCSCSCDCSCSCSCSCGCSCSCTC
jgi:hypothetical protein